MTDFLAQAWHVVADWLLSPGGQTIMTTVALPFAAILFAGLLSVLIARASSTRVMQHRDGAEKAAAIAALLAVSRRTTAWTGLAATERDHLDYQLTEATVRLRLLPIAGADLAAEWAGHQIAAIKRNSAALVAEAERGLVALEDGLILWHRRPAQAKRRFTDEIDYLRAGTASVDADLVARQKQWQALQDGRTAAPAVPAAAPFTTMSEGDGLADLLDRRAS